MAMKENTKTVITYLQGLADDVNVNRDENGERTIYMKVEFNHAGYGKTIPMMLPTATNGKSVIKTS
mgnify:CR=1 FL=1